jgi:hypothetical protein
VIAYILFCFYLGQIEARQGEVDLHHSVLYIIYIFKYTIFNATILFASRRRAIQLSINQCMCMTLRTYHNLLHPPRVVDVKSTGKGFLIGQPERLFAEIADNGYLAIRVDGWFDPLFSEGEL